MVAHLGWAMNKTLITFSLLASLSIVGCDQAPETFETDDVVAGSGGEDPQLAAPQEVELPDDEPDSEPPTSPNADDLAGGAVSESPNPSTVAPMISPADPCVFNSHCGSDGRCDAVPLPTGNQGFCVYECDTHSDCEIGERCNADGWCQVMVNTHDDFCINGGCERGQGDCEYSSECINGMTCMQNVGSAWGYPNPLTDVCDYPAGHIHYCKPDQPCAWGQGDCDNHSECAPGLACKHNVGAGYGFSSSTDVCLYPWQ